jgi:hypothetical protein
VSEVVQLSDAEKRSRARKKVAGAARAGKTPNDSATRDVLEWAFRGHEQELQELEQTAELVHAARREAQKAAQRSQELSYMTERVLVEWDEQARAERRQKAQVEARRRLGWEPLQ